MRYIIELSYAMDRTIPKAAEKGVKIYVKFDHMKIF